MHFAPHFAQAVAPTRSVLGRLFLLISLLAMPLAAAAEDAAADGAAANYARTGWYLGVGGVGASYRGLESHIEDVSGVADVNVESAIGLQLSAGYRGDEHLAVELAFNLLDDTDIKGGTAQRGWVDSWTAMAITKPYLMTGRVQPFLLAGMGAMYRKLHDFSGQEDAKTEFAVRFGTGVDFYTTEHIAISLGFGYVLPTGDLKDYDYLLFDWGVKYRF